MGGKRKTSKKAYKKKKGKKYKVPSYSHVKFVKKVKKVVNNTIHPEKKRYNCLRLFTDTNKNINWNMYGITVESTDTNTVRPVSDTDQGKRAPWQWYQLNVKPVLASSDTFYSMGGSKINLKYIYLKGYVIFNMLNANNGHARELHSRIGNLRLRIACVRGEMTPTTLNKYNEIYDNVETLASNTKNGIKLSDDILTWKAYHNMTRRQYAYKNLKIWTVKNWRWNRWNKAQSAQGAIADGSGTITSHADTGGSQIMIPFSYVLRINKNIIYRQTTNNVNDGYDECNLKYFYCFESDCGVESLYRD